MRPVPSPVTSTVISVLITTAVALAFGGCSSSGDQTTPNTSVSEGPLAGVKVTGAFGTAPQIEIDTPLKIDDTTARVITAGTGAPIIGDQLFVLQLTLVDGRTGKAAISTYDEGQQALAVRASDGTLFPALVEALDGQKQGSRIVLTATADDAYGDAGAPQHDIRPGSSIVMVADILAVPPTEVLAGPEGKVLPAPKGRPVPLVDGEDVTRLDFTGVAKAKPQKLIVIPLVEGTGPVARPNSLVTLDYLGQLYGTNEVFDETYSTEPATVPLGTGLVIKAWEQALSGAKRGSRLLVLTPPSLAFKASGSPPTIPGNATIAYVIDVLGVS